MLSKELYIKDKKMYDCQLSLIKIDELLDHGAKCSRVGKPTKKGTKLWFDSVKSEDELKTELNKLKEELKDIGEYIKEITKEFNK